MSDTPKKWVCTVCGYVHDGAEPPEFCPVCGATSDLFEEYEDPARPTVKKDKETPAAGESGMDGTIVIAGGGIAGVSAAESARKTSDRAVIKLVISEPHIPYYRLNLTRYLAGEIPAGELPLHPESWYEEQRIELVRNAELDEIDTANRVARLKGAEDLHYDRLILAVGSHPFIPPIPGTDMENVTVLRTKDDADLILERCREKPRCVVIGGGLLGLEAAGALAGRGLDVTLLERFGWLLPRQLNRTAGRMLEKYVESIGIKLMRSARTCGIAGEKKAEGVVLESGETIPAGLVIITTGVRPNIREAGGAGLDVDRGVIVDNFLQTSDTDIFAAGDVCEHMGITYGLWGPAKYQGTIAGINAAGGKAGFAGIPMSNILKVLGYDMFSIGRIKAGESGFRMVESADGDEYRYFLFRDKCLAGAILLGDTSLSPKVKDMIEKEIDCSRLLEKQPSAGEIVEFLKE